MLNNFVAYSDGSCLKNPGFGGYGVFGYIYRETEKSKNIKHPIHNTLYFTKNGISKEKDTTNIEVTEIVEVIKAINNPTSTNNEAELLAFINVFEKASEIEELKSLTIYTDSNYIVTSFNENIEKWKVNNWKRIDNKPIVHIREWTIIDQYKKDYADRNIELKVAWVKGHSEDYGNNVADMFSVVGSNSAKRQYAIQGNHTFNEVIFDSKMDYQTYKKSYGSKDIMLYFRDLYFSSNMLDDTNYCFLSTSENPNTLGKRDTTSIFVSNIGFVPEVINKLKDLYRNIPRNYTTTCCIKISKFENKDLYRLTSLVNIEDLLVRMEQGYKISYRLIKDSTPFMFENGSDYPFIINASSLFSRMMDIKEKIDNQDNTNLIVKDITERVVVDGKIAFSNKDKCIDFTDMLGNEINFKQKLLVSVGYDIPAYLALKNIEKDIEKVELIIENKTDSNFCTLYINIKTTDRNIYSVNIENKFLKNNFLPNITAIK